MTKQITGAVLAMLLTGGTVMLATTANAQGFLPPPPGGPGGGGFHRPFGGPHPFAPAAIRWSGSVDDRAVIVIRGGDVRSRAVSGGPIQNESIDVRKPLPPVPIHVELRRVSGRGTVDLTQEPNPRNHFTAIVRIHDFGKGRGDYSFTLAWR